jgi:hypothetical protein
MVVDHNRIDHPGQGARDGELSHASKTDKANH